MIRLWYVTSRGSVREFQREVTGRKDECASPQLESRKNRIQGGGCSIRTPRALKGDGSGVSWLRWMMTKSLGNYLGSEKVRRILCGECPELNQREA
ncbi:hypothetical protein TNCT_279061 [Trichonephila clavata]|uniref:Uncharacterized protein n=1 Tax=Trichonephila clavata TaxID=2740835 RepID=A0A8X6LK32_TRICU|nr:hypothetical protein TNCT_279061 [Trichonephila clavata]